MVSRAGNQYSKGVKPTEQQQRIIQEGKESKATVLLYSDWLVTTCNESIPDNQWSFPDPHPSSLQYEDIDDMDQDYHDLTNSVERHTYCSPAYCLKRKVGRPVTKCRYNFPRPLLSKSTLTFEKLTDSSIHGTLTTKRNDPRVNSHNRVMLQNWRANIDIQVIVDVQACARYMAKYAAKGEPRSKDVQSLFRSCTENTSNSSNGHQILRRAMLRSVGERDFSAQETGHMLLSLPLSSCTYNFCSVSLTNSRRVSKDQKSGEMTIYSSHLQQYSSRDPLLAQVNLKDFFAKYTVNDNDVKLRPQPVIVRTFPSYSYNPQGENYSLYCRFQLLKYHPWSNSTFYTWQTGDATEHENVDSYKELLRTPEGQANIPTFAEELERAQLYHHQNDPPSDEDEDSAHHEEQEDWMVLCQLHQDLSTVSNSPNDVDWAYYCRMLPPATIIEAAEWIQTTKVNMHGQGLTTQRRTVDITTLNREQSIAYLIVQHHHSSLSLNQQPLPLRMIVCGTAGTGKSYLINAIVQCLRNKAIITGTTGMAAFNIGGETLHSVLQLPIRSTNKKELQGSSLQRLQIKLKHKHYLLIDEMSMLGQTTFAWVDKRLRQATGKLDEPLGGMSVILFGDFAQLGDRPLFAPASNQQLPFHGFTVYRHFTTVVILQQIQRQCGTNPEDQAFRELLTRLRNGEVNKDDCELLLNHSPDQVHNYSPFKDAVHLFYDKKSVAEYNHSKLVQLATPVAAINAIHSGVNNAAAVKPDDAGGLYPTVLMAEGADVMLTANIWQQVGLCNGAAGVVYKLKYQVEHSPPNLPIAVLVEFPHYTGPPFLPDHPKYVPIVPITFEWESKSRQQLPLQLRYAMAIHKSQGQTLGKTVIDIGKSEVSSGCTFVAMS